MQRTHLKRENSDPGSQPVFILKPFEKERFVEAEIDFSFTFTNQYAHKILQYIIILCLCLQHRTRIRWIRCLPVVDKEHKSSTWVKVQIRIIKYYTSKIKSTASILLEWKYKSTHFFMYLSKKVLIDLFSNFVIDYLITFYICAYFNNPTAQNTCVFPPNIHYIESRYIFCWYGLRWWEWCSNVHCEVYTAMYLRENRFQHLIFTSKKKCFRTCCSAEHHSYIWHENKA